MPALVECVPNFSEGRDKSKVDAIVEAMKMDGVYLLDREMDADHNRCVITLVGDPVNVAEAAIRGVGKAAELIDLTKHSGAHPRLGAADVVPFIPIEGVSLEDCVAIAREVGEEIWKRYKVPVYLYEAAAQRPERQNLENVRRGQFEGIREEVKSNRFSNGGLRYVKGMGVGVRGLAQVSMNLTDTDQTPIARVFEYVKREAARYGVLPLSSEIVGLIPKKALEEAAEWFLQIENFDSSLILENRLAAVMSGKMTVGGIRAGVEPFIEQLAAPTAAPGGGSASAATGAMAAALGCMVAGMSRGKKAYLQYEAQLSDALARLAELREQFKASIDADAESFNVVMAAFKKAKEHPEAEAEVEAATKKATLVPLVVAERAREVRQLLESLRAMTNPKMASDLTVGVALANAASEGALANVEINLGDIKDETFVADVRKRVKSVG